MLKALSSSSSKEIFSKSVIFSSNEIIIFSFIFPWFNPIRSLGFVSEQKCQNKVILAQIDLKNYLQPPLDRFWVNIIIFFEICNFFHDFFTATFESILSLQKDGAFGGTSNVALQERIGNWKLELNSTIKRLSPSRWSLSPNAFLTLPSEGNRYTFNQITNIKKHSFSVPMTHNLKTLLLWYNNYLSSNQNPTRRLWVLAS